MGSFMQTPLTKPLGSRIIGIVLLVAFAGCAYYNTFYLARRYFREGNRAQERSLSDTPTPEAVQKYDATIRQCAKILVDYPKSKWLDDALYTMGAAMYGKGDYLGAIKKFGELRANVPKSPFVPDSKLLEALSHYRRKEYVEAETMFREVETEFPKLERKWDLYFYGAETEVGLRNYPGAIAWYGRAAEFAKKKRQRADSYRRMGDALYESARYDSAQAVYVEALKSEEVGGRRIDLAMKRGDALEQLKRYDQALAHYQSWKPYAVNEKREGEVLIRIYRVQSLLGKTKDALEGYQSLVNLYPHTAIAFEAQFRTGYLYESQLNDFDGAAREYDKLKSEPGYSEFQVQAQRRSANLATMKTYRTTLQSDTAEARPRAAFLLAELYYFQIEKVDSALLQYETVERGFPKSPYAPKAAFARLWIETHDRSDTLAAANLTDLIVARYPKTRYPESALYLWRRWSGRTDQRTALLDSMLAHPDTTVARARAVEDLLPVRSLADTLTTRTAPMGITTAEAARRDSLEAYQRALIKAAREGKVPPQPATPQNQPQPSQPPPRQLAPADTAGLPTVQPGR
jgi:TolA-binding protein